MFHFSKQLTGGSLLVQHRFGLPGAQGGQGRPSAIRQSPAETAEEKPGIFDQSSVRNHRKTWEFPIKCGFICYLIIQNLDWLEAYIGFYEYEHMWKPTKRSQWYYKWVEIIPRLSWFIALGLSHDGKHLDNKLQNRRHTWENWGCFLLGSLPFWKKQT